MTVSRRRFVAGSLAFVPLALASHGARAQSSNLKISHQFPGGTIDQGDFRDRLCRRFAADVEKKSGGALKFDIYPNSSLVKVNSQFSALRRGALDLVFAAMPVVGDGIRNYSLPALEMVFVGRLRPSSRRVWDLREIAEHGVLTFQRGSQPHAALMDQFKAAQIESSRVHSISSISAMVKLLECGFGLAMLPRAAAQSLIETNPQYAIVRCSTPLTPFPVHASNRTDPSSNTLDAVVSQAIEFVYRFSGREAPSFKRRTASVVRRRSEVHKKNR
jgi:hypothetical protein